MADEERIFLEESTSQNIQSTETTKSFEGSAMFKIYWPITDRGDLYRIGVKISADILKGSRSMEFGKIPKKWLWELPTTKVKFGDRTMRNFPFSHKEDLFIELARMFYMYLDKEKGALLFQSENDKGNIFEALADPELIRAKKLSVAFETVGGTLKNAKIWIFNKKYSSRNSFELLTPMSDMRWIYLKESTSRSIRSTQTKRAFKYSTVFKIYWPINDRGDLFRIGVRTPADILEDSRSMEFGKIPEKWLWELPTTKVKFDYETTRYFPRRYFSHKKDLKLAETFYMFLYIDKDKGALWFRSDKEKFGEALADPELRANKLSVAFETDGGTFENVKIWILNYM